MMHRIYKALYTLFIVAIGLFGLLLVASYIGIGGLSARIVQSGSMEPAIKTGSLVLIKEADDYRVGDVITFLFNRSDDVPTTHRIVEERAASGEMRYLTKGDANEDVDPREITEESVIGKVFFSVPYVGYLIDFARKPLGFVLLIGIPALVIVYEEVSKIVSEVRRGRKEKGKETEKENENP